MREPCLSHLQFTVASIITSGTNKNDCGFLTIFINEQKVVNVSFDQISMHTIGRNLNFNLDSTVIAATRLWFLLRYFPSELWTCKIR